MNIAIEAQRLFRKKKHGMEIVALEIIRQLQQLDKENQYYILARNGEDENCISATENFHLKKIKAFSYPDWEQIKLPLIVKKIKPALLHCTANTAPLFGRIPLIITLHDIIFLESVSFSGSSYQNFGNLYRRFIVPKITKKAQVILTVSEYEKKVISEKLKISERKIQVVYNGVNPDFKLINKEDLLNFKDAYKLADNFILHFGNTAPKKNTIGVLKAYGVYLNNNPDGLPLVITDCTSEYVESLLKQINKPDLMKKIQILNYIPFAKVPYLYNLATVFLYPSHRESFGMPVIEAMACGIPVITSNTSALPEISGDAAILVDPNHPDELAEGINSLLSNSDFYKTQKDKGFINASRFNWKVAAEKTLSVYNEFKN